MQVSQMPVPSVGRIVHYKSYGTPNGEYKPECRAAMITAVTEHPDADGTCTLAVFNPDGLFLKGNIPHYEDAVKPGGSWHWPEMV